MAWELFEQAARTYEAWYATPRGRRADLAERALLRWLLAFFPQAASILEVGCGTGHFTEWLTHRYRWVIGLDRAPTMLTQLRRRAPTVPILRGDAHRLPLRSGAVDLAVFVTTLEFLDAHEMALSEAVRVAREGVVCVVLNRWSVGGLSRRWGAQSRRMLLSQAHDYSVPALRVLMKRATGERLREIHWTSTLFPGFLWNVKWPIPVGEVLGMAAVLAP